MYLWVHCRIRKRKNMRIFLFATMMLLSGAIPAQVQTGTIVVKKPKSDSIAIQLDTNVISFHFNYESNGQFQDTALFGSYIPAQLLKGVKPGTKIICYCILARGENGETLKLPAREFVLK